MSAQSIAYYQHRIAVLESLLRHMPVDALLRAEKAAAAPTEEDVEAAATTERYALDADPTIVPDRVDWHAETQEPRS